MRAYPAEYRHDRTEEIIDALLEATPDGLAYPSARDSWSLIAGGVHARAARNRGQGAAASLRLALLLGIAIFLSLSIDFTLAMPGPGESGGGRPWLTVAACILATAAGMAPWLLSRAATAALAIPAGVLVAIVLCGPQGYGLTEGDTAWLAWMLAA